MNFIGHATVALWSRTEPLFVLGSMLPDFAGMVGTRLRPSGPGTLSEGIALHHRTDAVFHGAATFMALMRAALDELEASGVARGTARAVGHIGVEMLIDGELVREQAVASAYAEALRAGAALDETFVDAAGAARFQLLRARLLSLGAPYDYRDPASVVRRLEHVLRGRPRLAMDPRSSAIVGAMLPGLQRKVVDSMDALLAEVRSALT